MSISMVFIFSSAVSFVVPTTMVFDLALPKLILYLLVTSSVIFRSLFWSGRLFVMMATSSTHSRQVADGFDVCSLGCL